jgi:hypothetical protein
MSQGLGASGVACKIDVDARERPRGQVGEGISKSTNRAIGINSSTEGSGQVGTRWKVPETVKRLKGLEILTGLKMNKPPTGEETTADQIEWEKYVPKQLTHQGERKEGFYFKLVSDQTEEFDRQKCDSSTFDKFDR